MGLRGRTLGLLGFGSIAQELAHRAQAFAMDIVIWSRRFELATRRRDLRQPTASIWRQAESRVTIARTPARWPRPLMSSAFIWPSAPRRAGLVDAELLPALRPGSIFINTSRAEIVDYDALVEAVRDRGIRVGLDVYPDEPTTGKGEYSHPILDLPGVYGTHHIGASTEQAQEAVAAETVRIVRAFKDTGEALNCVNPSARTKELAHD